MSQILNSGIEKGNLANLRYLSANSPFHFKNTAVSLTESGLEQFLPRIGVLSCPHGSIPTPNFIFCGTKANVKMMSSQDLNSVHTDIILANTYHLLLSPGPNLIQDQGGLHQFMNWNGPLFSDSGGYQVFAMGHGSISAEIKGKRRIGDVTKSGKKLLKINENGVEFRSYINGSKILLTPESSIQIQQQFGVDFMVQFDECTPFHVSRDYTEASMELSSRWGERSLQEFLHLDNGTQAIYGVVQGGVYPDLRARSIAALQARPFFGEAIGGCLGKTRSQMWQVVADCTEKMLHHRPIHLLGIGHVADIFWGVLHGITTFDCVHPTRLARHGCAILPHALASNPNNRGLQSAQVNVRLQRFQQDKSPLMQKEQLFQKGSVVLPDELSYCMSYVHHLFRCNEVLGGQILTMNNVFQMNALMRDIRYGISHNQMGDVLQYWLGLDWQSFFSLGQNH